MKSHSSIPMPVRMAVPSRPSGASGSSERRLGVKRSLAELYLGVRYVRGCIEPCLPDLSPDNPAVLIMDGHGSHFTLELLTYCRTIGLHILLRPPHTTHILQGEDVQHFAVFKPEYHQSKMLALGTKILGGSYKLTASDLLQCARAPWETAFNMENSVKAWDKIGVAPFTRRVYWELKEAEEKRIKVAKEVEMDPELMTVHGMVSIMFPDAKRAADKGRKRSRDTLNSSDLWDLPGGATGDECYAIVKAKTDARLAKEQQSKATKAKRARAAQERTAAANALGHAVINALTHTGQVARLKVDHLRAALAYRGAHTDSATARALKTAKKGDLVLKLSELLRLPADGPIPPLVVPDAPTAASSSNDPEEPCSDSADSESSSSDNESEGDDAL